MEVRGAVEHMAVIALESFECQDPAFGLGQGWLDRLWDP